MDYADIKRALVGCRFTANVATLDVDLKGSAQAMADELALKNFGSFKVEVTGFSPNRLDLRVVPQ